LALASQFIIRFELGVFFTSLKHGMTIDIVRKSRRKHFSFNSVSNDLLPFMVGQIHDNFTLLSAKDVMLFQHSQKAIQVLTRHEVQTRGTLKQTWVSRNMFVFLCPWVSDRLKNAEILDCCHYQQCRSLMTLLGQKGRKIRYCTIANFSNSEKVTCTYLGLYGWTHSGDLLRELLTMEDTMCIVIHVLGWTTFTACNTTSLHMCSSLANTHTTLLFITHTQILKKKRKKKK
jgi:hypothetical protein